MAGLILSDGPREKPKSSASSPSPPSSAKTSPLRTTNQMDVCSSKDTKNKRTKLSPWKRPEGEMLKLLTDLRTCRHEIAHEPKRHREDDNPDYFLSNVNHVVEGQEVFKRQKIDGILDDLIKEDVVDHLKKNNPNF
ncbi:hypothetical protein V9T40_004376 [Parthenolecanium corni]|uniref:Uncharacterized protein n=1 Tax=Parthenolecanium corni TaxID=536013 RepID=A0AAN9U3D0_9HEMI